MNYKIAVAVLAIPIGVTSLLTKSVSAAEVNSTLEASQSSMVVAQRYDDRREDARREELRRVELRRNEIRQENAQRDQLRRESNRQVWIPGHYEPGFLGIGRKWVEGHWEERR